MSALTVSADAAYSTTLARLSSPATTTVRGNVAMPGSSTHRAMTIGASTVAPGATRTTIGAVVKSSFISAKTSVGSAMAMPSASSGSVTTSTPGAATSSETTRPLTVTIVTPRTGTVASAASIGPGIPPATGESSAGVYASRSSSAIRLYRHTSSSADG